MLQVEQKLVEIKLDNHLVEKKVSDTDLACSYLINVLNKTDPQFQKLAQKYRIKDVHALNIGAGKGHLSYVYKTVVHFDGTDETYRIILKLPTVEVIKRISKESNLEQTEDIMQHQRDMIQNTHNQECDFYAMFSGRDCPIPQIMHMEKTDPSKGIKGILIMESFADRAATHGWYAHVTAGQCKSLAKGLAKFQAQVSQVGDKLWMEAFSDIFRTDTEHRKILLDLRQQLIDFNPSLFEDVLTKLYPYDNLDFILHAIRGRAEELGCLTLCHGDMWGNNVMFETNPDGTVSDRLACFVDWQLPFPGNPLFDIARFVCSCVDADVRREIHNDIVDFYYDQLLEEYKRFGEKVKFTREQAQELYEIALIQQSLEFSMMIMFFKTAPEGVPDHVHEARLARFALRMHFALKDCLKFVEDWKLSRFAQVVCF